MIVKVFAGDVPLTPELAREIASMDSLPGERPMKPKRMAHFNALVKNNLWCSSVWSLALDKSTGRWYRADGQHTSNTLTALPPENFPRNKSVTIQRFEIDSLAEDAVALFEMFDNPASARDNADVMGLHRSKYEDLTALGNLHLIHAAAAIDYYLRGQSPETRGNLFSPRERGLYYTNPMHRRFAIWLNQWSSCKNTWMLSMPGIGATIMQSWSFDPDLAGLFWGWVLRNDHPEVGHETRELADTLKAYHNGKLKRSQEEFREKTAQVWGRFRRSELKKEQGQVRGQGHERRSA